MSTTINPPPTKSPIVNSTSEQQSGLAIIASRQIGGIKPANTNTVGQEWQEFFSAIFSALSGIQQSGTTAQRPVKGLWVGRPYFDTTLGYAINYNGTSWVNSVGAPV
jgi:hypothetical protein